MIKRLVLLLALGYAGYYFFQQQDLNIRKSIQEKAAGAREALRPSQNVLVAILDTGLDLSRAPEVATRLLPRTEDSPQSWNAMDRNDDGLDENGHGTLVAREIMRACASCSLLPIKVTRQGGGIRADDIAAGLRYAALRGARVAYLSFSVAVNSPALAESMQEAHARRMVVVTAAGGAFGALPAQSLETLYPQAYADTWVIGAAEAMDRPDAASNYGDPLDLVQIQLRGSTELGGSAFAAAQLAGRVAMFAQEHPELSSAELRAVFRAATSAPPKADFARMGFGAFHPGIPLAFPKDGWTYHLYPDFQLDLSAADNITSAGAIWRCRGPRAAEPPLRPNSLKKGRARLRLGPPALPDCVADLRFVLASGRSVSAEIPAIPR